MFTTFIIIVLSAICFTILYILEQSLLKVSQSYDELHRRLDKIENLSRYLENISSMESKYLRNITAKRLVMDKNDKDKKSFTNKTAKSHGELRILRKPTCAYDYDFIIIVQSRISHFSQRMLIRNTWGQCSINVASKCKTFFIVAKSKFEKDLVLLNKEFDEFQDIIVGDTTENFYTLIVKLQMAFLWSINHCRYKYMLKADDDIFVNVKQLFSFFANADTPKEKLYAGNVQFEAWVQKWGKYAVSEAEFQRYKKSIYPRYCSGGGFVLSFDVVIKMCEHFDSVPPMSIDDAYVGELALKSGVDAFHNVRFNMYITNCKYDKELIVHHPVKTRECMEELFDAFKAGQ